jgi:hypothetical protein
VSTSLIVECEFHFDRWGRGGRKKVESGPAPTPPPARIPRISRFMALAIRLGKQMQDGEYTNQREIGDVGGVTRERVSQIMGLLNLAPDLQEVILLLPRVERGHDPIVLRDVLPITKIADWSKQRERWKELLQSATSHK